MSYYCPACHDVLSQAGIQNCPRCQKGTNSIVDNNHLRKIILRIDEILFKKDASLAEEFQKIIGQETLKSLGLTTTLNERNVKSFVVDAAKLAKLNRASNELENALGQDQSIVSELYEQAKQAGRDMMADRRYYE